MKIFFIVGNYPNEKSPASGAFVRQFVLAMSSIGHQCKVISPISIFQKGNLGIRTEHYREEISNNHIDVYRPRFFSFSSKKIFLFHTGKLTQFFFSRSVKKTMDHIVIKPDILYGHFLYPSGFAARKIAVKFNLPVFIGVGEDSPWTLQTYGINSGRLHFKENCFFIPNSSKNLEMLKNLLNIDSERMLMAPNGVDLTKFSPKDKNILRLKFGFSLNWFIVAFVGTNEIRKGANRLIKAVEDISNLKCIFIGKGTENLESDKIIFKGQVAQEKIPDLIGCADVFVLPTLSEGSCNAVIEAMACGLPIITSNGSHMDDIVDDYMSIRVDANNTQSIKNAISEIQINEIKRIEMSKASLQKSVNFDVVNRAKNITRFINSVCNV